MDILQAETGVRDGLEAMRGAIRAAYRAPEPACVPPLVEEARFDPAMAAKVESLARRLVSRLRAERGHAFGVEALMKEFSLSTPEGVALMCLAESLLRIPDSETRDRLIRDKLSQGDWRSHLGASPSWFVNASAWGLLITGKLVTTSSEQGMGAALARAAARGGEPVIRKAMDLAMRLLGRQFVTGQTIEEALDHARPFEARGFLYSFDMLGEAALTEEDAATYMASYERAIARHRRGRPRAQHLRSARHFGEAVRAASALQLHADGSRHERASPAAAEACPACSRARHRLQYRRRGSRQAGAVARSLRGAGERQRARALAGPWLCRAGLSEARALCDRRAHPACRTHEAPTDDPPRQGRVLGQRNQARSG